VWGDTIEVTPSGAPPWEAPLGVSATRRVVQGPKCQVSVAFLTWDLDFGTAREAEHCPTQRTAGAPAGNRSLLPYPAETGVNTAAGLRRSP